MDSKKISTSKLPIDEPASLSLALWRNGFPPQDLNRVLAFLEGFSPSAIEAGRTLINEGDPAENLFAVRTGKFEVLRRGPDGRQARVAVLGPGSLLGEMGVLSGAPRAATVRAIENASVFTISRSDLRWLMGQSTEFAEQVNQLASARRKEIAA